MLFQYCKFLMPGPLKRGTVGASTLILSKDIDKILLCEVQILMKQTLSRWWIRHKCLYLRTQNITLNQNRYPHRPEQNYFVLFAMRYPVLFSWHDYFYSYYQVQKGCLIYLSKTLTEEQRPWSSSPPRTLPAATMPSHTPGSYQPGRERASATTACGHQTFHIRNLSFVLICITLWM